MSALALLEKREAACAARLRRAQVNARRNIRNRVAGGIPIPIDEIRRSSRGFGLLYAQHERALRELNEYVERKA